MRVLLVTDSRGVGGAEISLGHLAAEVDADVTVVGCAAPVVERVRARRDCTAHVVAPAALPGLVLRLGAQADVVHLNKSVPWAAGRETAAALAAGRRRRPRVTATEQLPLRTVVLPHWLAVRALARRLDAHVAVGRASCRRVEDFYALGRGTVLSIPNGVPDHRQVRTSTGPAGRLCVAILGRLDRVKGHDVALRALPHLPEVSLLLLGDGGRHPHLSALAADLGVSDRVTFHGWAEHPAGVLRDADALLLPSRSEGFPLSLVEGMLAGLPVVATSVGSVPELIDPGRTGLLVPPEDPMALVAALSELVDDTALRTHLGAQARAHALAHHTAGRMAGDYLQLWEELLGREGQPRVRAAAARP